MEGMRVAGCDLGKTSVGFVTGCVEADGTLVLGEPHYALHDGKPFDLLKAWYDRENIAGCSVLGATGMYAVELALPVLRLPEDSCQEAALYIMPGLPETLNLVSVGARGYGVLTRQPRDPGGGGGRAAARVRYLENDKCSSGTGENMQRIASRFGLSLPEADALATAADAKISITARCSVFAKSEMTHYANQGEAASDLFAGYFTSVARNARSLLARNEVDGPVYLIGGCAQIESFKSAFADGVAQEVILPAGFLTFEAVGAAALAAEELRAASGLAPLPQRADSLIRVREQRFKALDPAHQWRDRVTMMPAPKGFRSILVGDL